MRKYLLEIVIGLLVFLSIGVVLALGYLSYTRISTIVATIHRDARPNEKLAHIKELALQLEKAENSIRIYAFTHKTKDLSYYNKLLKIRTSMLDTLKADGEGNEKFLSQVDTIQWLVENKIRVWRKMIPLYGVQQTSQYLDTLSGALESKIAQDSLRKNRNIFKKVFQRSKKTEIDKEQIIEDIEQHKQKDQQISKTIHQNELELAATNSQLTERLYNLIHKMEDEEAILMAEKEAKANDLAGQTFVQVKRIAVGGIIAALLVVLVILRYTQSTRASQRALQKAKTEAERLAAAKELFVANVSHEIRTPVNLISGFTTQLLKKNPGKEIRDDLLIIKSSSDHLARIVDDVLDFSKLQSDKMKLHPVHFSLQSLCDEIYEAFKAKADDASVKLQSSIDDDLPLYLWGDPVRLKQILINLVGNAIKFSPKGNVWFSFHKAKNQEDNRLGLELRVRDDGIGIEKTKQDLIFEDFTQAESYTTKKFGGTGLGLSIVKKLVEIQGGTIHVESETGEGSRFICVIPYETGDVSKIEINPSGNMAIPESVRKMNVLIVDDESYNRKLIEYILKNWKVSYEEAADGLEAIECLKKNKFDLVLLDLRMPRLDGIKVSRFIRETLGFSSREVVVILITAAAVAPPDEQKFKEAGINSWLPKPFSENELLDALIQMQQIPQEPHPEKISKKEEARENLSSASLQLDELYHVANDDEKFVKEMLERLLIAFDEGKENIQKAIDHKNLSEIAEATHKLASPSRHVGADQLLQSIKSLEKLAESNEDMTGIQRAVDLLFVEMGKARRAIEEHLKMKY